MLKRILAALLCAAVMAPLAACGGESDAPAPAANAETAAADEGVVEEAAETEPPRPESGLPDTDWGGKSYRISCFHEGDIKTLAVEEMTGEVVDDAIFRRNSELMEKYNFKLDVQLSVSNGDYGAHQNFVKKMIAAGEDAFELIYTHVIGGPNMAVAGYFVDLHEVPNLNFDQPWWPHQSVDEMTVYGRMFTICSGINQAQLSSGKVVFFNKNLLESAGQENPYQDVKDGKWTIDALTARSKGFYIDLNGDGTQNEEDQYGYSTDVRQNGFLVSCNTPVLSPTEDGGREISVLSDRTVTLVEKVYDWYYESNDVMRFNDYDQNVTFFSHGKSAYAFSKLSASTVYRTSDVIYGIVPQPKFDEAQESYYVFACPSLFGVPLTASDLDFAGFVFEAMTYAGYYDVIPTYYEITLKGKVADSQDDVEMLELINDHLTVSFAYCYDNWEGFAHLFNSRMGFNEKKGNRDMASMYEKNVKKAQKRLDKILAAFSEYGA